MNYHTCSNFIRMLALLSLTVLTCACSNGSDSDNVVVNQPAIDRNLPITVEQDAGLPDYNIYRPADLRSTGAPLPVIVWGNGACVRFDGPWKSLLERWASAGFLVLSPQLSPGTDPDTAGSTTVAQQIEALDWAVAENARAGSPFAGRLDLDRVVAAGNSCGGIIALNFASVDDRIKAVFVLSGSSAPPGSPEEMFAAVMGNILVPVGYAIGGPEDIATTYAQLDYSLLPEGVPGYIASRFEGTHVDVSIGAGVLEEVEEISTQWIDFALNGDPQVQQALLDNPCLSCAPATWSVQSKNLDLNMAR